MSSGGITERTLYRPIANFLEAIGFRSFEEVGDRKKGYVDLKCYYKDLQFIIEVKIAKADQSLKNFLDGISQASIYSKKYNANGSIVIEFPNEIRSPVYTPVSNPDFFNKLVIETPISAFVSNDFWTDFFIEKKQVSIKELMSAFKEKTEAFIESKKREISFDLAINILSECINNIAKILRNFAGPNKKNLVNRVVGRFDLFLALGEISTKSQDALNYIAIDLVSYLITNQIMFYHIYSSLTNNVSPLEAENIKSVSDLKSKFKEITDINYKTIYDIDVISELIDVPGIVENIQQLIRAISHSKVEYIQHDLLGRLYHELLPPDTRKKLAAFFTKPNSSEILSRLTIDDFNESIIDPACGSGTLLVASYRQKIDLATNQNEKKYLTNDEKDQLHKDFTENQITGIDIMPFSTHLASINLASQNPNTTTNKLRIAVYDSCEISNHANISNFISDKGMEIASGFGRVSQIISSLQISQTRLEDFTDKQNKINESVVGAVNADGIGESFIIKPFSNVIMNPPYSDRRKLPATYRNKLSQFDRLEKKCGSNIHFWGYFMALADDLLQKKGKVGAVIPINIARGKSTATIRSYYLKNYKFRYIVKTTKEIAFSEDCSYRDMLFIAEKTKPKKEDLTGIIFLKKSIDEITLDKAKEISNVIKRIVPNTDYFFEDDDIEINFVGYNTLIKNQNNLMPVISCLSLNRQNYFKELLQTFLESNKLIPIDEKWIKTGWPPSPKGVNDVIILTRNLTKDRIKRASLIFDDEDEKFIYAYQKDINYKLKIPKSITKKALRTITGVKSIDLTSNSDYFILNEYPNFMEIIKFSKLDLNKFSWEKLQHEFELTGETNIILPDKINVASPHTNFFSLFSKEPFIPTNSFYLYNQNKNINEAKILCLYFNSVVMFIQFLLRKSEALGNHTRLKIDDWIEIYVPDFKKLTEKQTAKLVSIYDEISNIEFPSFTEQFSNDFYAREILDRAILSIFKLNDDEIDSLLNKLYPTIASELKDMQDMKQ